MRSTSRFKSTRKVGMAKVIGAVAVSPSDVRCRVMTSALNSMPSSCETFSGRSVMLLPEVGCGLESS